LIHLHPETLRCLRLYPLSANMSETPILPGFSVRG
jgi:hypothetical protein